MNRTAVSRGFFFAVTSAALALAAACGSADSGTDPSAGAGGGSDFSNIFGNAGSPTGFGGSSGAVAGQSGVSGTTTIPTGDGVAEVFAHSENTLYRLDPVSKAVTVIGPFRGCGGVAVGTGPFDAPQNGVLDIALDKASNMYGTTADAIYRIDRTTAVCTLLAQVNDQINSLSFVPQGTLDQNTEALVGYLGSQYVRIDVTTGQVTPIGDLGAPPYVSSGDIVSVIGGGTYLTVHNPNCFMAGCQDSLVQVDPRTGNMIKDFGQLGYTEVYGLAFWAGLAYGFTNAGQLFQVDVTTGQTITMPIQIPNPPQGLHFWGAGSTTSAPPVAVH